MIIALLARQIDPIALLFHRLDFKEVRSIHASCFSVHCMRKDVALAGALGLLNAGMAWIRRWSRRREKAFHGLYFF